MSNILATRHSIAGLALAFSAGAALAAPVTIDVPGADTVEVTSGAYQCGSMTITVDYINAGPVSLAVLHMPDDFVVASNVISGSGARYAGAQYIWWSQGDEADLYDLMQGGEDGPGIHCLPV